MLDKYGQRGPLGTKQIDIKDKLSTKKYDVREGVRLHENYDI
ncbi:hypothetical protein RV08_GL001024 [Enterococcus mundtii]|uniref:Uncharacterized protein n=1 Tax=Enterococcus mundtii TaxID=53346 RepID=A0ABQ0VED3_ENTMU|nr:hypothetical protein RV08_GL001024 [Enterococcus mundtii]GEL80946.1 hypothetical protein EMU01_20900 [Enterococcus mundtii]GEN19091.1 hypothetical protein LAC02_23720 [Ligilactobacillus acidipiscis]